MAFPISASAGKLILGVPGVDPGIHVFGGDEHIALHPSPRRLVLSTEEHSRSDLQKYPRRPADLPTHGRKVQLLPLILVIPLAYSSGMASSIS